MGFKESINNFIEKQKFCFTVDQHLNQVGATRVELDFGRESENIEILSHNGRVNVQDVINTVKELARKDDEIKVIVIDKDNSVFSETDFPQSFKIVA